MIRIMERRAITDDKDYVELNCLSTDNKPTEGLVTGSFALEVDTSEAYFFDEVSGTWIKAGGE